MKIGAEVSSNYKRFEDVVKCAKRKSLVKSIIVSISTTVFLHWIMQRKVILFQNRRK